MNPLLGVLEHIKSTHGVLGACILSDQQVLASNLPNAFKAESLLKVSRETKLMKRAVDSLNLGSRHVVFDSSAGKLIVYPLDDNHNIIVVCTRGVHIELLLMSVHVSSPEVLELISQGPMSDAPASVQSGPYAMGTPASATPISYQTPMGATPISGVIASPVSEVAAAQVQKALARHVGPAARVVWKSALKRWAKEGGTLESLVTGVASEISDPSKRNEFIRTAKGILGI